MNNNIIQMAMQIKNNPAQLGQLLYQNGKINQEQFSQLQGKNPSQIGQYLLENNILPKTQYEQLQQRAQQLQGLINR